MVTLDPGNNIDDENFTATFTGGPVSLRNRSGKVRDCFSLACPNLDEIIMVVDRQRRPSIRWCR